MIDHLTVPVIYRSGSAHSSLTPNEAALPLFESAQYSPRLVGNWPAPLAAAYIPVIELTGTVPIRVPIQKLLVGSGVPGAYTSTIEVAGETTPAMAAVPVADSQVASVTVIDGPPGTLTVTITSSGALLPPSPVAVSV